MNKFLMILILLTSFTSFASDKKDNKNSKNHDDNKIHQDNKRKPGKHHQPNPYCIFDVIPLNSPVKESTARFLIKIPNGFDIDEVSYQVKNSGRLFEKVKTHQRINLVDGEDGKELRISASKLPPGFYQLFVKIKDRNFKDHYFKTKFKDHAMFVVDNSLQVPMPDPQLNDKTIAGIDSDNDGIRDDIQRWINESFSSDPKVKFVMRELAIGKQLRLISSNNKEESVAATSKALNDATCLDYVLGVENGAKMENLLDSRLLNTKDRLYADIKSSGNFSGQLWTLPGTPEKKQAICVFDPNEL